MNTRDQTTTASLPTRKNFWQLVLPKLIPVGGGISSNMAGASQASTANNLGSTQHRRGPSLSVLAQDDVEDAGFKHTRSLECHSEGVERPKRLERSEEVLSE